MRKTEEHAQAWWYPPEPSNSPALVRFAIEARLGQYEGTPGRSGRQEYAIRRDLSSQGVTERLNAPARIGQIAEDVELAGLAPAGSISRFAARLDLPTDQRAMRSIGPAWWPRLAKASGLSKGDPDFRTSDDVILAGHSLVEWVHHRASWTTSPRDSVDPVAIGPEIDELVRALVRLASGPFGVADEAIEVLTGIAPFAPDQLVDAARSSPMGLKVVRSLDRSLRLGTHVRSEMSRTVGDLLATPPERIMFRLVWLRALRRLMWSDLQHGRTEPKSWAVHQLLRALNNEGAYAWATPSERRYVLWVLAEFAPEHGEYSWADAAELATEDEELFDLLPTAEAARRQLAASDGQLELPDYRPTDGWPCSPHLRASIDAWSHAAQRGANGLGDVWGTWAKRKARASTAYLVGEALTTPCATRLRRCCDALLTAGPAARDAATTLVIRMIDESMQRGQVRRYEVERAVSTVGYFRSRQGVEWLEAVLKSSQAQDEAIGRTAIIAAANLSTKHPDETPGLRAWARNAAEQHPSEACAAAGMYLSVVSGDQQWTLIPGETWLVSSMRTWCKEISVDSLYVQAMRMSGPSDF